jgi:hypothetical protein
VAVRAATGAVKAVAVAARAAAAVIDCRKD